MSNIPNLEQQVRDLTACPPDIPLLEHLKKHGRAWLEERERLQEEAERIIVRLTRERDHALERLAKKPEIPNMWQCEICHGWFEKSVEHEEDGEVVVYTAMLDNDAVPNVCVNCRRTKELIAQREAEINRVIEDCADICSQHATEYCTPRNEPEIPCITDILALRKGVSHD